MPKDLGPSRPLGAPRTPYDRNQNPTASQRYGGVFRRFVETAKETVEYVGGTVGAGLSYLVGATGRKRLRATPTPQADDSLLRQMTFQCKDLNGEVRSRREECADIRAARENSQAELERVHIRLSAQKALMANVVQESEMMLQAAAVGGHASQAGALVLAESLQLLCLETDTDAAIARARELQAFAKFLEEMELRVAHHIREVNAIPQRLEKATAQKQAMIATASQFTEKISGLQRRLAETTAATVAAQEKKAMSEARHISVQNRTFELEDQRTTHLPEALKKAEARKVEAAARHAELVAKKEALTREAVAIQEDTLRITAEAEADEKAAMETKQSTLGSMITTTHLEEIEGRMAVATAECAEMEGAAVTLRHLLKGAVLTSQAARDALTQKEEELKAQLEAEKSRQQRRMKSRLEKSAARLRNVHEKQRGRVMDEEGVHRTHLEYHWMVLMQEHTARQCLIEAEADSFTALAAPPNTPQRSGYIQSPLGILERRKKIIEALEVLERAKRDDVPPSAPGRRRVFKATAEEVQKWLKEKKIGSFCLKTIQTDLAVIRVWKGE